MSSHARARKQLTGITDLLGGGLLLLGLDGRGDAERVSTRIQGRVSRAGHNSRVNGTLDVVGGLLNVGLLGVGLGSSSDLVGEGLSALG